VMRSGFLPAPGAPLPAANGIFSNGFE
jgi:hypothetical protein